MKGQLIMKSLNSFLVRISSVLKLDLVKMLVLAGYFELVFRLRYEKVNQNE